MTNKLTTRPIAPVSCVRLHFAPVRIFKSAIYSNGHRIVQLIQNLHVCNSPDMIGGLRQAIDNFGGVSGDAIFLHEACTHIDFSWNIG